MYKILTIFGTRPEIIRLSCIIQKLDKLFNHKCVNTGQNFDVNLNKIFVGLRQAPDYFCHEHGGTHFQVINANPKSERSPSIDKEISTRIQIERSTSIDIERFLKFPDNPGIQILAKHPMLLESLCKVKPVFWAKQMGL